MVRRMATPKETLRIGDREVTISNPSKVYFPEMGYTKNERLDRKAQARVDRLAIASLFLPV